MEKVAIGWELIRRTCPELQWQPFYDIGPFVATNLRSRIIPESERFRFAEKITTEVSPVGWSDADADGWRKNLGLTKYALGQNFSTKFKPTEQEVNEVLQRSLTVDDLLARLKKRKKDLPSIAGHLRWIDAQALQKGIKLPNGLTGRHNRPPSWDWVEILDISRYVATRANPIRKLSPAERKMKTLAIQRGRRLSATYKTAMEEIKGAIGYENEPASDLFARYRKRLLGNWEPPKTNW